MEIVIDTNMLMSIVQFKIHLFSELKKLGYTKFFILSKTMDELRDIKGSKPVIQYIEQMIENGNVKIIRNEGPVDSDLLTLGMPIATNDRGIIDKAKAMGIRIVRLRQRKYLVEE